MTTRKLTSPRKLFSILTGAYDEGYIHPGFALPGPEIPRLEADKEFEGTIWVAGGPDPEWVRPDEISIHIGTVNGRDYYSIRDDVSTYKKDMGSCSAYDPQTHKTVDAETFEALRNSPTLRLVFEQEGVKTEEQRFKEAFPDFASIKEAVLADAQAVAAFLAADLVVDTEVLAKLGVIKAPEVV